MSVQAPIAVVDLFDNDELAEIQQAAEERGVSFGALIQQAVQEELRPWKSIR